MNLKVVTMTGADDSVKQDDLFKLSEKYPFVEWGILFGNGDGTASRFPSYKWIEKLLQDAPKTLRLCAHLCGLWVFEALIYKQLNELITDFPQFQRVQLNTHGVRGKHLYQTPDWTKTLATMKQIIFQWDGHNNENVEKWSKAGLGVPLFDTSSGAGVLPGSWPKAVEGVYCGYAGGLGPANVVDQLKTIEPATNGQPFWIDMETRVRSSKDRLFDLAKVIDVLEKCEPFVMKD